MGATILYMLTRNAIVISISVVLLFVSIALILVSNKKVPPEVDGQQQVTLYETGNAYVSSPVFESFLIRSDETSEDSTRPIFFGKSLFEMQASGEILEISIPDNKGVLSAQYSPNKKNVALSFCEFEGNKLCGLYLYNLETREMTYLTEDEPGSDYAKPVWLSDEEIAYLHNVAEINETQKFLSFRATLENPYDRTMIGSEGEYDCLYIDANSNGEIVLGCKNGTENTTRVIHYSNEGEELEMYDVDGLLTGVEISDDGDVFALVSSEQSNNVTGLFSLKKNNFIQKRVRSISMLSSDVFAYTESLSDTYFIVSDAGYTEQIKSPGIIMLDSK